MHDNVQTIEAELEEVLRDEARKARGRRDGYWCAMMWPENERADDSISSRLAKRLKRPSLVLTPIQTQTLRGALNRYEADGLVVYGGIGSYYTGGDQPFTFTERGLRFFLDGPFSLTRDSSLKDALVELQKRRPDAVDDGQIVLLAEAHTCWLQGCYRAAMVLVGVANEEALTALLDELKGYPARSATFTKDWDKATNSNNQIGTRTEGGMAILRRLQDTLRKEANGLKNAKQPKPDWADLWFRSVDSLSSFGEAVRYARNKAAHDGDAGFRRSDIALLLSSMPTLLEHVADMRAFLSDVAKRLGSVTPPTV